MKAPSLVLSDTMMIDKWHILYKLEHKNCANDKNKYQLFYIFWNIYCVKPEANKEQQEKTVCTCSEGSLLLFGKYDM